MSNWIFTAQKSIANKQPPSDGSAQKHTNRYNLRSQGIATVVELLNQKLKENCWGKSLHPSTQRRTVSESGKAVSMKIASMSNKDKTITLEATNQVTSPNTSVILPFVDYNIVDDIKKVHVNISMF